jgi:tRNA A-37 threonylcarbamoyl transferase component Bud32
MTVDISPTVNAMLGKLHYASIPAIIFWDLTASNVISDSVTEIIAMTVVLLEIA